MDDEDKEMYIGSSGVSFFAILLILSVGTETGEKIVNHFLQRGPDATIASDTCRKLIRDVQSFLPGAGITSRRLALEVFRTNRYNYICPYHSKYKDGSVHDGAGKGEYKLTGVALPRDMARLQQEGMKRPRREGFLDCGCSEDSALMDFYFWKTWTIEGEVDGEHVEESMGSQRFPPRLRAFVVEAFESFTKLTIDDLYTNGLDPVVHRARLVETQIDRLTEELEELNALLKEKEDEAKREKEKVEMRNKLFYQRKD
jgi:hypothetical protein